MKPTSKYNNSSKMPNKYKKKFFQSFYKINNQDNNKLPKESQMNMSMTKPKRKSKIIEKNEKNEKMSQSNKSKNCKLSQSSITLKKPITTIRKNLDDKFKSIEDAIIDSKYADDIDHDEMIITSTKRTPGINKQNELNTKFQILLENSNASSLRASMNSNHNRTKVGENECDQYTGVISNNGHNNVNNLTSVLISKDSVNKEKEEKNNIKDKEKKCDKTQSDKCNFDNEEEQSNCNVLNSNIIPFSNFEPLYQDFILMYDEEYSKSIVNEDILLELQLLIEKILELLIAFNEDNKVMKKEYFKTKTMFKLYKNLYAKMLKKMNNLEKYTRIKKNNSKNYIEDDKVCLVNLNISIIKNENKILSKLISGENEAKQNLLKIFKLKVCDKFITMRRHLNNVEKKIVENLMKKYKFFPKEIGIKSKDKNISKQNTTRKKNNDLSNNLNNNNTTSSSNNNKICSNNTKNTNKNIVKTYSTAKPNEEQINAFNSGNKGLNNKNKSLRMMETT